MPVDHRWMIAAFAVCFGFAGCGDVEPFDDGDIELRWDVAPMGCQEAEVERVSVVLEAGDREIDDEFRCDRTSAMIRGVRPGTYSARLQGLDPEETPAFQGGIDEIAVRPATTVRPERVDLVALPASIEVSWRFDDGRTCSDAGVDEIELAVFDASEHEVHRSRHRCGAPAEVVTGLHTGSHLLRIAAQGDGVTYAGAVERRMERAGEASVEILLAAEVVF